MFATMLKTAITTEVTASARCRLIITLETKINLFKKRKYFYAYCLFGIRRFFIAIVIKTVTNKFMRRATMATAGATLRKTSLL